MTLLYQYGCNLYNEYYNYFQPRFFCNIIIPHNDYSCQQYMYFRENLFLCLFQYSTRYILNSLLIVDNYRQKFIRINITRTIIVQYHFQFDAI